MFSNHAGINITETKLQIVEISYKDDSFYLENVEQAVHLESISPRMPEEKFISILQESFNRATKRKAVGSSRVSFALPNNFFKIFEIPYDDSLVKRDLNDHFRWELSVLFPECNNSDFYIQHIEIDKSRIRPEKKAIVLAIEKSLVKTINIFCVQNNLELKYVDNVHLASNAFLYLDKTVASDELALSLYIDQNYSSIAAIDRSSPFYFKILDSNSQNLFDELTRSVKTLEDFNLSLKDFSRILLYGQDLTDEFENKLKNLFGLPLKKTNPFEHLKVEQSVLENHFYKYKFNSFAAAAGIAIRII